MNARLNGFAAGPQLEVNFGIGVQEVLLQFDEGDVWLGNFKIGKDTGGDPFVNQNPFGLRIIGELDDIEITICCFEQMGLGATAHFS